MINKIAPDKWRHFMAGIVLGILLQAFLLYMIPAHVVLSILITFVLVAVIGYGFELASKISRRGHYDVIDAIATVIGGLVGMSLTLVLKLGILY